jgi:hypothetical protein
MDRRGVDISGSFLRHDLNCWGMSGQIDNRLTFKWYHNCLIMQIFGAIDKA